MIVYDELIKTTLTILENYEQKQLKVNPEVKWNLLKANEYLMGKEVAFELGERFKPCTTYNLATGDKNLIGNDDIILIGKDLPELKENTNFTRIALFNIDDEKDQNRTYLAIKKLDYERYKIIPEGYMILSSSFEQKENIRVSKKAIKNGLSFEILGNIYINHYKQMEGVNNVKIIFITGDYPMIPALCDLAKKTNEITETFDHVLKNVILDCEVCPLKTICNDIEALREEHFKKLEEQKAKEEEKKALLKAQKKQGWKRSK